MSTHEAIAALPTSGAASKPLIRAMATRRFAYCLDIGEAATSFTAVDPADGTLPLYIIQNNILFRYDSTDSTTANDGTTCLVTADTKRYKVSSVAFPYSVLNVNTSAQPTSPAPTIGDCYLVPTAATGADWAGKDSQITTYTAQGWVFTVAPIGRLLYDESADAFYHKDTAGDWVLGFGTQALGSGIVLPSNMSGGGGKVNWIVENQTTNTPPVSPTANVEYIIGGSPTGAWAGKATQIARYEGSAWTYYVPAAGWRAFDKSQNQFVYWSVAASSWQKVSSGYSTVSFTSIASTAALAGTNPAVVIGYAFDPNTPPTSTANMSVISEPMTATVQADYAGQLIEIDYQASLTAALGITHGSSGAYSRIKVIAAIYVDSETTARDWQLIFDMTQTSAASVDLTLAQAMRPVVRMLQMTLGDTSSHTITIRFHIWDDNAVNNIVATTLGVARRTLRIRKIS